MEEGEGSLDVALRNPHHEFALWEVAVQQPQGPGNERQVHGECIELQPLVIKIVRTQPLVMLTETQLKENMLPLDVEEHGTLDIDEDWISLLVHKHMVRSKLTMDKAVLVARAHDTSQLTNLLFQLLANLCHALDP